MKIIFSTDQIYLHGGIERVLAIKANYLAAIPNVEVYIVTSEQNNHQPCYALHKDVKIIDLDICYNRRKSYFSFENIRKAILHYWRQRKLFRGLKPEVVISPNFNFDHYWLPLIKGKAQVIKERHSSRYFEYNARNDANFLNKLRFRFNDWIDAKYDRIVVLNPDEKDFVYSENAVVIPNPIEKSSLMADMHQKRVIAAGRISPVKAFDELVEAWKIVVKDYPDWQLHIYGEDYVETKGQLQKKINDHKLGNVILFCGSVNNIPLTMCDYSIYAMSSKTECFPMVLLEALSVGLPVVSYDCPTGPRNIIVNFKEGFLVKDRNVSELARSLIKLMSDIDLRKEFSKNAKSRIELFETKAVMKQWLTLFDL